MLETGKSYAEQMMRVIKKERKKSRIDYVHPGNEISEGYIIVNYRKRNMEMKVLMDGRLSMMLPEDWKLWKKEQPQLYTYCSSVEKESMVLSLQDAGHAESLDTCIMEVNIHAAGKFSITEKGFMVNRQGIETEYRMVSDGKEVFSVLFECMAGTQKIQGNFLAHYYRRKVWKKVIPQMLEQMWIHMEGLGE